MTGQVWQAISSHLDEWHGRWGQERFFLTMAILCAFLGLCPLLIAGWPMGDDLNFHLYRIDQLSDAFRRGQFGVPIYSDAFDGYGYGVGLFYGDALLYPPALLRALGVPLTCAVKLYVAVLTLVLCLGSYFCALRISRSWFAGFAASVLIVWSSYFATDLFNRFAFGEVLAFACFPLACWGYYEILHGRKERWWLLTLGFTGMLLAHNLSFMLALLVFVLMALGHLKAWFRVPSRFGWLILSAIVCILLTAFFWGPMLEQLLCQRLTVMDVVHGDLSWRAMPWWRLFLGFPDLSVTQGGHVWTPPGLGLPLWGLACWQLFRHRHGLKNWMFGDCLTSLGLLCCILATDLAPWGSVLRHTALASLQFPWRFLLPGTCLLALGCSCFWGMRLRRNWPAQRRGLLVLILWCGAIWALNVGVAYWQGWNVRGMVYEALRLRSLELGVMHYFPSRLTEEAVYERGETAKCTGMICCVRLSRPNVGVLHCEIDGKGGTVELPLVYYKGYAAERTRDRQPLKVFGSRAGLVSVAVPADGNCGDISVWYDGTLVQRLARLISGLTLCMLMLRWVMVRWERRLLQAA